MENRYHNARIYRITCEDLTYIGSTCQALSKRFAKHKSCYNYWKNDKKKYMTSFKLFDIGNPIITLLEDFPCERKEQLLARERFYIENNECVNQVIPTRTKKEYLVDNAKKVKEMSKQYRTDHSDKIKEQNKQPWSCECCEVTIWLNSKTKHLKSKKHIDKNN